MLRSSDRKNFILFIKKTQKEEFSNSIEELKKKKKL
jgi:hypothetical protein